MVIRTPVAIALGLATIAGVIALFVLAMPMLTPDQASEQERFVEELRKATEPLRDEYSLPLSQNQPGVLCEYVDPASGSADCDTYVAAVAEANPSLQRSIAELRRLIEEIPRGTEQYVRPFLDDLITAFSTASQSNDLIVEGWRTKDDIVWEQGWQLRRRLIEEVARVLERANELKELADSPEQ